MPRSYALIAIALLVIGASFEWRSSRANDGEQQAPVSAAEATERQELLARIDALEKRIAKLEERDQVVRQADNREPIDRSQVAPPLFVPNAPDSQEGSKSTNGQAWRFRLLGHRQSTTGTTR